MEGQARPESPDLIFTARWKRSLVETPRHDLVRGNADDRIITHSERTCFAFQSLGASLDHHSAGLHGSMEAMSSTTNATLGITHVALLMESWMLGGPRSSSPPAASHLDVLAPGRAHAG